MIAAVWITVCCRGVIAPVTSLSAPQMNNVK